MEIPADSHPGLIQILNLVRELIQLNVGEIIVWIDNNQGRESGTRR